MFYRWKHPTSSGVLRLEISLFSGYELFSINPIPNSPPNLQHGSQANNLWFVFANVTSNCPICVQYLVRSSYVISSLRPAYARIYPASREDLAAETFFHMFSENSPLVSGITDDDYITWFGKNDTKNITDLENYAGCENVDSKTTTPSPTSIKTTTLPGIFSQKVSLPKKLNDTKKKNGNSTTGPQNKTVVTLMSKNRLNITIIPSKKTIVKNKSTNVVTKIQKKIALLTLTAQNKTKSKAAQERTTIPTTTQIPATTTTQINQKSEVSSSSTHEKSKHVNKELHEIPKDNTVLEETSTQETDFLSNKDSKFLILDKNELWGMLREVVQDEFDNRKTQEENVQKIRLQGST